MAVGLLFVGLLLSVGRTTALPQKIIPSTANQSDALSICSTIQDPDSCVSMTELGVHACSYCMTDQQCHVVGSVDNPCPNDCCASQSGASSCKFQHPEDIKFPDGECAHASNPMNHTAYDAKTAVRSYHLAGASYCDPGLLTTWTCKHCKEVTGIAVVKVVDVGDLQAFVAVDHEAERTILSFRGTVMSQLQNWISNLDAKQTSPYNDRLDIYVHEGFYKAYMSLQPGILAALSTLPKVVPVRIMGHSLGGALALLALMDLQHYQGYAVDLVHTFGGPRVGNFQFHNFIKTMENTVWRVTHHNDLVVHLPSEFMGFYHSSREIYYGGIEESVYHVCDSSGEDQAGSNQCANTASCTSIDDHLHYFGIAIGSDQC